MNRIHIIFANLSHKNPMACRARELVSLFLYKICDPRRYVTGGSLIYFPLLSMCVSSSQSIYDESIRFAICRHIIVLKNLAKFLRDWSDFRSDCFWPCRSDYKIEEHVGEEAEAKLNRFVNSFWKVCVFSSRSHRHILTKYFVNGFFFGVRLRTSTQVHELEADAELKRFLLLSMF